MKTYLPKDPGANRAWLLVDAEGKKVGRLAVHIANALRGKNKAVYTPHIDMGDFVVVINAAKIQLSGSKEQDKLYKRYSGYRGGLKIMTAAQVRQTRPERMIKSAVKRMLPGNNLSRKAFGRLKVYAGAEHPHAAQNPKPMRIA